MINPKFSLKQKGILASTQIIELMSERKGDDFSLR